MISRIGAVQTVEAGGEIILVTDKGFTATSCATSPALKGAAIHHGMQATFGAIDSVSFDQQPGCLEYSLIQPDAGNPQLPAGICRSGGASALSPSCCVPE